MAVYFARAVDSSNNYRQFKSTDGTSWTIGGIGDISAFRQVVMHNQSIMYYHGYDASIANYKLYRSIDAGVTFSQTPVNITTNSQNDVPLGNSTVKLSNGLMTITSPSGIYSSSNLAGKINTQTGALPARFSNISTSVLPQLVAMQYSPSTDYIYGCASNMIHVVNASTGASVRTYSVANAFENFRNDISLAVVPGAGIFQSGFGYHDIVYACDHIYKSMRKSTDSGATWTTMSFPAGFSPMGMHVDNSNILVVGSANSDNGKVVFSSNAGSSWSTINTVASIGTSEALIDIEKIKGHYFIVTSHPSPQSYKSTNNGSTWTGLSAISYNSTNYSIVDLEGSTAAHQIGVIRGTNAYAECSNTYQTLYYKFTTAIPISINKVKLQLTWNNNQSYDGFGPQIAVTIYSPRATFPQAFPANNTPWAKTNSHYVKNVIPKTGVQWSDGSNVMEMPFVADDYTTPVNASLPAGDYTIAIRFYPIYSDDVLRVYGTSTGETVPVGTSASYQTWTVAPNVELLQAPADNNAPTDIALSSYNIVENAGTNAVVGNLSATDAESNVSAYSLVAGTGDTHNSLFNVFQNGSTWQLRANNSFNYESMPAGASGKSLSVRVRATDSGTPALTFDKVLTINVTDANEAPTDIALSNASIAENNAINAVIGTLSTTDPDASNTFTYSLSGTDQASFNISGNSLRASAAFNYESKSSYSINIMSTDQGGLSYTKAFTISVTNVNEAPTVVSLSTSSITEGNAINAVIGALSATDPDAGNTFTYSIPSGLGNDKFNISGSSLRASVVFDYDTATSHSVTVRATDQGGEYKDQAFTITVANAIPSTPSLSSSTIAENSAAGTVIGTLSSIDPGGGTVTFRFASGGVDNGSFDIVGNQLKLKSGVSLDFETKSSYSIKVEAVDASNTASASAPFTISVTNVNEAPTDISLSVASIAENNAINAVIGTLSTTDPDAGNTFTYSIPAGLGDDKFNISGNQLRASVAFDYEIATSHSVTVRATDQGGEFFSKSFTISVTNDASDDPILLDSSMATERADGTVFAIISQSPVLKEVRFNNQPLPQGSVIRNSATGQKFYKIAGGSKEFYAIPITAPSEWGLSAEAEDSWDVLQSY